MNKFKYGFWVLFGALLISLAVFQQASAQSGIQTSKNEVGIQFPGSITFFLDASSQADILSVKLQYGTNGHTCQQGGVRQVLEFDPATDLSLDWEWELKRSGALPPGVEIWWQWEIEDQAGNQLLTERETALVVDGRHEWQELTEDLVTVQWYEGDLTFGQDLLAIAQNSLARLEREMGVRPTDEIRLIVYPSSAEVRDALIHTYEWAGGVAMPDYNSTIIGATAAEMDWAEEVITHELTHLVVGVLTFNCSGVWLPTWLNEGIAVFSEGDFAPESYDRLIQALDEGALPALETLEGGFSADPEEATLAYIQSGYVVEFLIQEYGREKFVSLLATVQSGETIDDALELIYALDTNGLDAAWRTSLGYEMALEATAEASPVPTQVPTLALWTSVVATTATETATPVPSPTPSPSPTLLPPSATATAIFTATPVATASAPDAEASSSNILLIVLGGLVGLIVLAAVFIFIRRKGS